MNRSTLLANSSSSADTTPFSVDGSDAARWTAGAARRSNILRRDLADQRQLDLQDERQERHVGRSFQNLRLKVQPAVQHQIVELVVGVALTLRGDGFATLRDDP